MHLLTLIAGAEFVFLLFNIVAWRRNILWVKEMHACNVDLAKALSLASEGQFAEAESVARNWQNRMQVAQSSMVWRVVDGKLEEWPWWRRWLGV